MVWGAFGVSLEVKALTDLRREMSVSESMLRQRGFQD